MKFTEIGKMAKRNKTVILETGIDGTQWVNVYEAVFKMDGVPYMTADEFLTMIGVSEKGRADWNMGEATTMTYAGSEREAVEITSDMAGITIHYNGRDLMPFYTADGVVFFDNFYIFPLLVDGGRYIHYFLLDRGYSRRVLIVQDGIFPIAYIKEYAETDLLSLKIKILHEQVQAEKGRTCYALKCEEEYGQEEII